ncbi:MAG: alanine racemase [Treponema sp.]|jgi:alanine racemase|nr:alanine racemase [Treponema sp.]
MRATKVIIHLDRFRGNMRFIRKKIGEKPFVCVPVKADAYGHGAVRIAQAALEAGARYLAVATVAEGAELRAAGISAPVLLLSIPFPSELSDMAALRLTPLIGDRDMARAVAEAAQQVGETLPVHLKIDTGMGRIGCRPEEAAQLAAYIASFSSLEYAGTATHLSVADSLIPEDIRYTKKQLVFFTEALKSVIGAGFDPGVVHAANSGAILLHEDACFDMVRPGILLYGYTPVEKLERETFAIQPVMELSTNIVLIKTVRKGEALSYGRTWTAMEDTRIATIPIGYGDGLSRQLSGKHSVRIQCRAYALAGRICMDQSMVDLGDDPAIKRWDEVTVFGGKADSAADLAAKLNTIPYEITCNINKRVPRVYQD